jgi:hypothetical protein
LIYHVGDVFNYDLLEVGPLNMIGLDVLHKVRPAVRSISSSSVCLNWRTDFSAWKDVRAFLHTGNRLSIILLSIHNVVENWNRKLEAIENVDDYLETIDEDRNIEVEISESIYN